MQRLKIELHDGIKRALISLAKEEALEIMMNDEELIETFKRIEKGEFEIKINVGEDLENLDLSLMSVCGDVDEMGYDIKGVVFAGSHRVVEAEITLTVDEDDEFAIGWMFSLNENDNKLCVVDFLFVNYFEYDKKGMNPRILEFDVSDDFGDVWKYINKINQENRLSSERKELRKVALQIINEEHQEVYKEQLSVLRESRVEYKQYAEMVELEFERGTVLAKLSDVKIKK